MARNIKLISTAILAGSALFLIYWSYRILSWLIPHLFADEAKWHKIHFVEDTAKIDPLMRSLYGLLWLGALAVGFCLAWFTIRLMWAYRNGEYFTPTTAKLIIATGFSLAAVGLYDSFMSSLIPIVLSMNNSDGPVQLRYWYDSGDITHMLSGLGFILIGLVTREAFNIARENESFL